MRKIIAALSIVVLLMTGMHRSDTHTFANAEAGALPVYNAEDIYEQYCGAVFYIRALQDDGTLLATGSGVVISTDGLAATAYHVIAGAEQVEAVLHDGSVVTGIEVRGYDELTDAGILKLPVAVDPETGDAQPYEALTVREPKVRPGEQVFAIGYPLKNTPIITEGIINSPDAEINGRSRILTSAEVVSGMSGGPLIDRHGRLAGVISGSLRTMDNIHLAISTEDLRNVSEP
jgi:S1-C subfamily serine protease